MKLYVEKLHQNSQLPTRGSQHSAGLDLYAHLTTAKATIWLSNNISTPRKCYGNSLNIAPGERALIPTGLKMAVEPGWCIKLYPRSGNSVKLGITLINAVGIGDADYRDEYMVAVINHSNKMVNIEHGMRICQMMVERVEDVEIVAGKLPVTDSDRNGGFGSTGVK